MNEREIFIEALEHADPDRRCQFLDQACAGDDDLRQRVEALLRKHDQAGSFLNHPPVNELLTELTDPGSESDASHGSAATAEEISLDFLEPAQQSDGIGRLGQYEILEAVGRGGMGIVLKAQDAKLNRVVAVKVLAPELASNPTARKRFSREAQAAAAVSHDHVVRIYAVHESQPSDGGDLPYLVAQCFGRVHVRDHRHAMPLRPPMAHPGLECLAKLRRTDDGRIGSRRR